MIRARGVRLAAAALLFSYTIGRAVAEGPLRFVQRMQTCGKPVTGDAFNDDSIRQPGISGVTMTPLDYQCNQDLEGKFQFSDVQTEVDYVDLVELDCATMTKLVQAPFLSFDFGDETYTAYKRGYTSYPELGNMHVWVGELVHRVGTVNIVWNEACTVDAFRFSITFGDTSGASSPSIRSVSPSKPLGATADVLSAGDATGVWLAHISGTPLSPNEEGDLPDPPPIAKDDSEGDFERKDEDILLLREVKQGNLAAATAFFANGGMLPGNGTAIMPSGRVLDNGATIRVLFAYTGKTRYQLTEAGIISTIIAGVAVANMIFANSQVAITIEAAAIMYTPYDERRGMLFALKDLTNGYVPGILDAREMYQADLVQLVTNNFEYCGLANTLQDASTLYEDWSTYSVVSNGCYSTFSQAHEIVHTLGGQHNYENAAHDGTWPTGFGYRYCDGDAPLFRTLMAYDCGYSSTAGRVPYLSSPDIYYKGRPTGTDTANNVAVVEDTRFTVANFRQGNQGQAVVLIPTDLFGTLPLPATPSPKPTPAPTPAPTLPPPTKPPTLPPTTLQPTLPPTQPIPMCAENMPGYMSSDKSVCCSVGCGACGGVGCEKRNGGYYSCCTSGILIVKKECAAGNQAPCMMKAATTGPITVPPTAAPTTLKPTPLPTAKPTVRPSTAVPTAKPTTPVPLTAKPTTSVPTRLPTAAPTRTGTSTEKGFDVPFTDIAAGLEATLTDLNGVIKDSTGVIGYINSGDSLVITLNVPTTGNYKVSYELSGGGTVANKATVIIGLLKGRVSCGSEKGCGGQAGLVSLTSFTTGGWNNYSWYPATSVALTAELKQEYTICFEQGSYVKLRSLCVSNTACKSG